MKQALDGPHERFLLECESTYILSDSHFVANSVECEKDLILDSLPTDHQGLGHQAVLVVPLRAHAQLLEEQSMADHVLVPWRVETAPQYFAAKKQMEVGTVAAQPARSELLTHSLPVSLLVSMETLLENAHDA